MVELSHEESFKTRTTCFMKCTERVLCSVQQQIELGDVGVCWEMICDIARGSVNRSSSTHCHIRKCGYTGHDAGKQHSDNSKNTQECSSNAVFQGNLDFIF